ncbi:conserved hypothetical protein [Desulforamulus reducens MI-1]|uniref:Uncharacterized protein n=1 Tax=Desulforamulus reducens (strain ATCC BAA-1160 / DSM 100696 / MI-1) TaxID=349161 RepID=A4J7Q6_DESRM|nr:hypothetical protein [Desulforamulus reducens]ABO51109.1 conserved hypothetical protein [Desulforamulus reducens MI-1]
MFESDRKITIRNKTYPLLFNVIALKEVCERYGGVEKLGEKLQEDYKKAISEYAWVISLLIRQGLALKNFEEDTNEKAPTPEQLEIIMTPKELFSQQPTIIGAINDGMDSGEQEETEEVDEVLEEVLASKNGKGAEGK